jgi:hypothetical protein
MPSFRKHRRIIEFTNDLGRTELQDFVRLTYTIGGMMMFPGNRIEGKSTINGVRGLNRRIRDRFDLTVECIRRHYHRESSPLSDALARYSSFFGLFGDFSGYVNFFGSS